MQPEPLAIGHLPAEVDELLKREGISDLYGWWNGPQAVLDGRTPAEAWIVGEYAAVAALVGSAQRGQDIRLREAVSAMLTGTASARRLAFLARTSPDSAAS